MLVLLFTYTGFSKVFAFESYQGTLMNQPLPHALIRPLSYILPAAELLTALGLLIPKTSHLALRSSFILLTIFTLYIGSILLHFFPKTPCSCGGIFRSLTWAQHLWLNLMLWSLNLYALLYRKPFLHM
ncbi:MAG: hypothetical protein JST68_12565 [Bacteroidetes bacterium]|nr:hypothetical protein [Bacteroidota bacterium]